MGSATAYASPNIALIKYWGKADLDNNKPSTTSLSMTLSGLGSTTSVSFDKSMERDVFMLNGIQDPSMLERVSGCLDEFRRLAQVDTRATVHSINDFPTGSGLASSASGFAALVMAADAALGTGLSKSELSRLARRFSGSAARSIFGGWVVLDKEKEDSAAESLFEPAHFPLGVAIAIISRAAKPVSSTLGMLHTQKTSAYYDAWVKTSDEDVKAAKEALVNRDFDALGVVSEYNCMKMHGSMMASRPGILYWLPGTISCIHFVRLLRENEGLPVFFTSDAGPQVKIFCLPDILDHVAEELSSVEGVLEVVKATTGEGARLLDNP